MFLIFFADLTVKIEGNQNIHENFIRSKLPSKLTDDSEFINETYKKLAELKIFKTIRFDKKGNNLTIVVQEYPRINKLAFEGNKKVKDEELKKLLDESKIKPSQPFPDDPHVMSDIVKKVEELYRMHSIPVRVAVQKIQKPNNVVDVIFKIEENTRAKIEKIRFMGNKHFSSGKLKSALESREYSPLRFFKEERFYIKERVESNDTQLLTIYMRNNGFPDAKVVHAYAERQEGSSNYVLTFQVDEGDKYNFDEPELEKSDELKKDINLVRLKEKLQLKKGQSYSIEKIRSSLLNLQKELIKMGLNTVVVEPEEKRDQKNKLLKLSFRLTKGAKINIRHINISGNDRTYEHVIRDYLLLREGDMFNHVLLFESEKRLQETGFFKSVKVEPRHIDDHTIDINIKVEEQRTGSFQFALSYGQWQGAGVTLGFTEHNIKGSGKTISADATIYQRDQLIRVGMSNPRFLRRDINAGFDVKYNRNTQNDYRTRHDAGVDWFVNYDLSDNLSQGWNLFVGFEKIAKRNSHHKRYQDITYDTALNVRDNVGSVSKDDFKHVGRVLARSKNPESETFEMPAFKQIDESIKNEKNVAKIRELKSGKDFEKNTYTNKELARARKEFQAIYEKLSNSDDRYAETVKRLSAKSKKLLIDHDVIKDFIIPRERREELLKRDYGEHFVTNLTHSLTLRPQIFSSTYPGRVLFRMENSVAGLAGNVKYMENSISSNYRHLLTDTIILTTRAAYGFVNRWGGDDLRISDCKTLGGPTFPGFDYNGVGPRDITTGLNVGGREYYYGMTEINFPTPLTTDSLDIRFGVFLAYGSTHNSKFKNQKKEPLYGVDMEIVDKPFIRVSTGVSLSFRTPMGPLELRYGIPLRKLKRFDKESKKWEDVDQELRFSLGYTTVF